MPRSRFHRVVLRLGVACIALVGAVATTQAQDAGGLLEARCGSCHEARPDGGLARIADARKTPEAWFMTIVRMTMNHGVELTDEERRTLVKYLSDTQGLAPAETTGYRYALEKTPGVIDEAPSDELFQMCGRCHTYARVALQRRDRDEWLKLAHFHLGQFPTTEYQALGRDRDWFGIATTEVVEALAGMYPFTTEEWTAWKDRPAPDMSGSWRIAGRQPGKGAFDGTMEVTAAGDDTYEVTLSATFSDGTSVERTGRAILYTGHEWRASIANDDNVVRQVFGVAEDGNAMSGRWMIRGDETIGGHTTAVRMDGAAPQILGIDPSYLRQGETSQVTISGVGLEATVDLGPGVEVTVVTGTPEQVVVNATASASAETGAREVRAGGASLAGGFVVYDKVDRLAVEPEQTIARVGGAGGPIPPVPAQFEAIGYMAGPDGEIGTEDDIRIGPMDAEWSVAGFDETADALEDAKFAGSITGAGLFEPAGAGPNPERPMSTNNAGNLSVIARIREGDGTVDGQAQLFVTVQRFVDTPMW